MPLLLLSTLSYGLSVHPAAVPTPRAPAASTPSGRRDVLAGAGAAAAFAMLGLPSGAQASYAMYQASQDSYLDRKATNFVPVATNDKATLKGIQSDIAARKPQYRAVKAKKKPAQCCAMSKTSWLSLRPAGAPEASLSARSRPRLRPAPAILGQPAAQAALSGPLLGPCSRRRYCAGQTAGVQPMLENICAEYGLSKADQSNTAMDEYGGRRRFTTEADGLAPLAPLVLAPLAPQLAAPAPHGPAPHGLAPHAVLCCTALAPARQHGHRQLQGRLQVCRGQRLWHAPSRKVER